LNKPIWELLPIYRTPLTPPWDVGDSTRQGNTKKKKKIKKYDKKKKKSRNISGENHPAKNYTCNEKGVFTLIYHLSPIGTILLLHLTACSLIASYEVVVCGVPPK
jgi:hypothetical protein